MPNPTGVGPAESARGPRLGTVQIVDANDVNAATFFDADGFHQIDGQGTTTFNGDVMIGDSGFIVQEGDVAVNGDLTVTGDTRIGLVDAIGGGNANVTVTGGATLATTGGETFVLIANDGTDAVTGTFNGLAEGSIVTLDVGGMADQLFRISYFYLVKLRHNSLIISDLKFFNRISVSG